MKFSQRKVHFTNMKTIIKVIFFGILTVAPNPVTSNACQSTLPAKQDLKIQDFFKSSWFVTHIKDGGNGAACREYKFSIKDGLVKLSADGEYIFQGEKQSYTTTCSSTSGRPLNPAGPFLLKCVNKTRLGNTFFELKLTVIDTDYSNYALVYRCYNYDDKELNVPNANLFVLLHRSKTADGSKATASLNKNGLSLNQFKKTAGC